MDWFLYNSDLCHKRVKDLKYFLDIVHDYIYWPTIMAKWCTIRKMFSKMFHALSTNYSSWPQNLKLIEWFKIWKIENLKNGRWYVHEIKNSEIVPQSLHFRT